MPVGIMELCFWIRFKAKWESFRKTEQDCNQARMWFIVTFVSAESCVLFVLTRLKDPGQERTESRTHTATRTSSKTAVRCSVGQHTRGNDFSLYLSHSCLLFGAKKVTERIVSISSVLDRRGLMPEELSIPAAPAAPSSSSPVPQTTVSTCTQTWP